MNTMLRSLRVTVAAAIVALLASSAFAQTTLTSTTLSAAIANAADQSMTIASATGWTASSSTGQTFAVVDREVLGVRALNGTQVSITRGMQGTRATGHISGAKVYFVTGGSFALSGNDRSGACSTTGSSDQSQSAAFVPVLNPSTGRAFTCSNGTWSLISDMIGAPTCTVTQATSKSTGVTCQGTSGVITMNAAGLATVTSVQFTVTDAAVAATDTIAVSIASGATASSYQVAVEAVAAGSFKVNLRNYTGGTLSEAVVLNFKVVKD